MKEAQYSQFPFCAPPSLSPQDPCTKLVHCFWCFPLEDFQKTQNYKNKMYQDILINFIWLPINYLNLERNKPEAFIPMYTSHICFSPILVNVATIHAVTQVNSYLGNLDFLLFHILTQSICDCNLQNLSPR